MKFFRVLLLCLIGILPETVKSQSFEKCRKLLDELLNEFNRAYEENNPAVLKDSRYLKKLNELRKAYAAYHSVTYTPGDSVARLNNEAVLLALSGHHFRAVQQFRSAEGEALPSIVGYHKGLIELLSGDFENAAGTLRNAGQPNARLNAMVASGSLPAGESGGGLPLAAPGYDPKGKWSYNRGVMLWRAGKKEEAVGSFNDALAASDELVYRIRRGDAYAGLGDMNKALADFARSGRRSPRAMVRHGNALLRAGRFEEARRLFETCLKNRERSSRYDAYLGIANSYYEQGLYTEARGYYEKVAGYKRLALYGHYGLAGIALAGHQYQSARNRFNSILSKDSTFLHARLGRGVARYGLRDFSGALEDFSNSDSLIGASGKIMADVLVCRGYSNYYLGRADRAGEDFGQALELDPGRYEALAGLGGIQIDRRRYAEAGKYLSEALRYEKEYDRLWVNYGNLLMHFNMYDKAFSVFNTAAGLNPANVHAQNGRGITLLERDMLADSRALFDSLLRTNPGKPFLLNNRGIVNAYLGNRFSQYGEQHHADRSYTLAGKDFNQAMENDTSRRFYHVNKGNVFRYWQQYEDARMSYQSYQDKSALNNTAVLLAGLERMKDARYYMGVALQIDSTHRVFQYNMNVLAQGKAKETARFLASARDNGPYAEISIKYSLDGYVTIYLYDYEYQEMHFAGRHRLPLPLMDLSDDYLIPEYDFTFLPYAENRKEPVVRKKQGKGLKVKLRGRSRSGTKCPVLL